MIDKEKHCSSQIARRQLRIYNLFFPKHEEIRNNNRCIFVHGFILKQYIFLEKDASKLIKDININIKGILTHYFIHLFDLLNYSS